MCDLEMHMLRNLEALVTAGGQFSMLRHNFSTQDHGRSRSRPRHKSGSFGVGLEIQSNPNIKLASFKISPFEYTVHL